MRDLRERHPLALAALGRDSSHIQQIFERDAVPATAHRPAGHPGTSTARATTARPSGCRRSSPRPTTAAPRPEFDSSASAGHQGDHRLPASPWRHRRGLDRRREASRDGRSWSPLRGSARSVRLLAGRRARRALLLGGVRDGDLQVVSTARATGATGGRGRRSSVRPGHPIGDGADPLAVGEEDARPRSGWTATNSELWGTRPAADENLLVQQGAVLEVHCPDELSGVRLDGASPCRRGRKGRLFVIARKHLERADPQADRAVRDHRRLRGRPDRIVEWGELPSAGDSVLRRCRPSAARALISLVFEPARGRPELLEGSGGQTDIWQAMLDLSKLRRVERFRPDPAGAYPP